MSEGLGVKGYLSAGELKSAPGIPSEERMRQGPVAVIECIQEIPCNPCEAACPTGAIDIGSPITNLPRLDEGKCIGCRLCVSACPGLAIFMVDLTYSDESATVTFPYEYLPLPEKGQTVRAMNRAGEPVCAGTVIRVQNPRVNDKTPVVTVAVPHRYAAEVRGILRVRR
ncbi:MAG: 4Fe-4S binding protein [Candidatus Bipolaricaulota bacterium]|nr:4Fe-4S binding protein [Candidatus Bipolaricaulota bacterium]